MPWDMPACPRAPRRGLNLQGSPSVPHSHPPRMWGSGWLGRTHSYTGFLLIGAFALCRMLLAGLLQDQSSHPENSCHKPGRGFLQTHR